MKNIQLALVVVLMGAAAPVRAQDKQGNQAKPSASVQAAISRVIVALNAEAGGDAEKTYQGFIDAINRGDLVKFRTEGNPNFPDGISLRELEKNLAEVRSDIADAEEGLQKASQTDSQTDLSHIVWVINTVPRPTSGMATNIHGIIRDLYKRKEYWQSKQDDFTKSLTYVEGKLDLRNTRKVPDPDKLGALNFESAAFEREEARNTLRDAEYETRELVAEIDQMAAQINTALGAGLPLLSGFTLTLMQDNIKAYGNNLRAVKMPQSDDANVTQAQINVNNITERLPQVRYQLLRRSEAERALLVLDDEVDNVLPQTWQMLKNLVSMTEKVKDDLDADIAWTTNMGDPNFRANLDNQQAVVDRKKILLRDSMFPPLREAERVIDKVRIPFQNKYIDSARAPSGDLFKVYDAKKALIIDLRQNTGS